ncbi:hypothetical protein C7C56_006020 [Massilia glaciei]|uniref:Uncharacterized protein n=2 Tax=Massilia glaciei TaxID=1524097 RepID=A0A2U2I486_9BURK|nr:hypothetical protein C7C56_006020 [Massilia glaciei]
MVTPTPAAQLPRTEAGPPIDAIELARLNGYAAFVLNALKEQLGDAAGYDVKSLSILSKNVSDKRLGYDGETAGKIATLYGAFLGQTLITCFPKAAPAWIRANGGVGIAMRSPSGAVSLVFPVASLTSHIEQGEQFSLLRCFSAVAASLAGPSQQRAEPEPAARIAPDVKPLPATPVDADALAAPVSAPVAAPLPKPVAAPIPEPVAAPITSPVEAQAAVSAKSARPAFMRQALAPTPAFDLGPDDKGNPLILHLPEACCNCSHRTYTVAKETPLKLGGGQGIEVDFAYCGRCAFTAGKLPLRLAVHAALLGVAYAGLIIATLWSGRLLALAVLAPPLIAAAVYFSLHRARGRMTSNYQPVRLAGLERGSLGIRKLVLRFSNKEYAAEFGSLNENRVSDGTIEITHARMIRLHNRPYG